MAELSIEEGHGTEAEVAARDLRREFAVEKASDDQLMAGIVLVKALLAQRRQGDAQHELDSIQEPAKKSQNQFARLQYALAEARVKISSDHPADCLPLLAQINQETKRFGFSGLQLEGRLLQADLALKLNRLSDSTVQLTAIENSARAAGFGLVSNKAKLERSASRNAPIL